MSRGLPIPLTNSRFRCSRRPSRRFDRFVPLGGEQADTWHVYIRRVTFQLKTHPQYSHQTVSLHQHQRILPYTQHTTNTLNFSDFQDEATADLDQERNEDPELGSCGADHHGSRRHHSCLCQDRYRECKRQRRCLGPQRGE